MVKKIVDTLEFFDHPAGGLEVRVTKEFHTI